MVDEENKPIHKIAIVGAPNLADTEKEAVAISAFLNARGIETQHGFLYDEAIYRLVKQGEFDLLIALGGDGTMLRAGHLGGPRCQILGSTWAASGERDRPGRVGRIPTAHDRR
jgi:NAD+ kinase